jgi:mannose-6-phosphate isomerase-like protein (cupin superfamily)
VSPAAIDLFSTFVRLQGADAQAVTWTPDFWRTTAFGDSDRVMGAKHAERPSDFHADESEMHPLGDELLLLLTGAVDVALEEPGGPRVISLHPGQVCIVPRGVWHRVILREPGDLVFVTPPKGTQLRPAAA